jgi:hypothetical protein
MIILASGSPRSEQSDCPTSLYLKYVKEGSELYGLSFLGSHTLRIERSTYSFTLLPLPSSPSPLLSLSQLLTPVYGHVILHCPDSQKRPQTVHPRTGDTVAGRELVELGGTDL